VPPRPATAADASGAASSETIDRLQALDELRTQGVLTDDEVERQKQRLLAG
jgi:hypothetical protein